MLNALSTPLNIVLSPSPHALDDRLIAAEEYCMVKLNWTWHEKHKELYSLQLHTKILRNAVNCTRIKVKMPYICDY